jgi:hypothetical protein
MGVVGTLLVHLLVIQSVVLGAHAHKVRPPESEGVGAASMKSQFVPTETLILINMPQTLTTYEPLIEELASAGRALRDLPVTVLSDDPLPHVDVPKEDLSDEKSAVAAVDSGDAAMQAAMFGRYTGQIDARIERAWRRPRSPVNPISDRRSDSTKQASASGDFMCQVRIIQDQHGYVQEVQVLDCNGSVAWQQSLVTAIIASSPLAAPPTPAVFTRSLTMTFTATPYSAASSADDYEFASASTPDRQ